MNDFDKIFSVVWPIIAILAGSYVCLGAWIAGLPIHWKHSNKPVPPLSRFGGGLFFICGGLIILLNDLIPKMIIYAFVIVAMSAFSLIGFGQALEARKLSQKSYRLPFERRLMTNDEEQGWHFAFAGLVFVGILVWLLFFCSR